MRQKTFLVIFAWAAITAIPVAAAVTDEDISALLAEHAAASFQYMKDGNYAGLLELLEIPLEEHVPGDSLPDWQLKMQSQSYNMLGFQQRAKPDTLNPWQPTSNTNASNLAMLEMHAAETEVLKLAAVHQIILFNEAHNEGIQREFIRRILPELYAQGFRYLAAETFYASPEILEQNTVNGTVGQHLGHYTKETVFAAEVEAALALGFQLVGYEITSLQREASPAPTSEAESVAQREEAQANNLIENILTIDPDAKILIHAGYSHIREELETRNDRNWLWMAARLKSKTGINPLTVDLVGGSSLKGYAELDRVTTQVQTEIKLDHSVVFQSPEKDYLVSEAYQDNVDVSVFFPRYGYENARPEWLFETGERRKVSMADYLDQLPAGYLMIQAFRVDDPANAVPEDQFPILPERGSKIAVLALFPGTYKVGYQTPDGVFTELDIIGVR